MKNRGLHYLLAFLSFIVAVGLACSAVSPTPTAVPEPTSVPATEAAVDTTTDTTDSNTSTGGDLITFTDKNDYFQIDVPGDWKHETSSDDNYYIDTFTSPDEAAVVESIVYDDGTPFVSGDNGKFALQILNENYSNTGKEGDIKVTNDSIQKDGSERLTWTSKSGGYSGYSFFELRSKTTFLMFTVDWGNDYKDQYVDILDSVIASYRVP